MALGALLGLSPGSARSVDEPFVCAGDSLAEAYISTTDPLVVARIVFVAFPDEPPERQNLPSWASTLRAELADFIRVMSHNQQNFDISILTRPDDPTKAWIANSPACTYSSDFGELNTQIMETIAAQVPGTPWQNVEQVFMIHYTCAWQTQLGLGCGVGGVSFLALKPDRPIPGFTAPGRGGTSQHMLSGSCTAYGAINDYPQYEWTVWAALTSTDTGSPASITHRTPESTRLRRSTTDYDAMNGSGSWPKYKDGLVPYHALNLVRAGWLPVQTIASTTLNVAVKDVCDATAVLSGLPPLGARLDAPSLFPLKRRITLRCQLAGLRREELEPLLQHRFGAEEAARIPEVVRADLFERTRATPALIDQIVRMALRHHRGSLDADAIRAILDLQGL
jgi:hypothetical protein